MSPTRGESPRGRGRLPAVVRVRTETSEASYQAFPPLPPGLVPEPLLSFMPHWRPTRGVGRASPAEQIQRLIDQRDREIAELRALQARYLPPAQPASEVPTSSGPPPVDPAA